MEESILTLEEWEGIKKIKNICTDNDCGTCPFSYHHPGHNMYNHCIFENYPEKWATLLVH